MCGIAGFIGAKNDQLIHQMSEDIKHRGPDGDGFYIDDDISLVSRRLAIIDRAGGDQPIYNENKSIVVVYNGEIYNYLELRDELTQAGHHFSTKSDTEVIVHAYEEWGDDCFDRFNGMFGAALYDIPKKRLILARDHFGIKPVYYAVMSRQSSAGNQMIFSSEIKPILYSGLVEKKVNERILYRYLKFRIHDDQEDTFFEGIQRLLPGQLLIFENGQSQIHHYSSLEKDILKSVGKDHGRSLHTKDIDKFRQLLTDSVRLRLISEVPVGTCLSGGLDSSTVVALVNKLLHQHVKEAESVGSKQNTFSAVFPGSSNDEEKYIDALLKKTEDVESHKVYPKPEAFFEDLEDFIKTQEEPTISTGPYAQYQVMREATKHVTVLLDGQGADEMMAGYLPYYFVYLKQLESEGLYEKLIREVWSSKDVLTKYFMRSLPWFKKNVPVNLLLETTFTKKHSSETFKTTNSNLKKRLFDDIFKNSLQSLLRYEDRNTMRFSIEGRVPFLDFRLVRYLFSLSNEAIIKNGWNKYILRESTRNLLPEKISNRRNKIGFTTPEHEWFMRMKNRIYGVFMSESFMNRPYFNQPEVVKAFRAFIEGKNDDTLVFWRLLNVELWLREFIDNRRLTADNRRLKELLDPNEGKKLEIEVERNIFKRYPIRTELFQKGDNYAKKIATYVDSFLHYLTVDKRWYVIVSEKVVAISQGRSFFIWDIKPTWWANTLSKFVKKTPYGIGLGSPWTMQIAIDEIGLGRILAATIISAITKPLGMQGMFYKVAGGEINAIDGPTEYSIYPSNVSAKLAPKDPHHAAQKISEEIKKVQPENFGGAVIIDANDLGRNVLGNATDQPDSFFEEVMKDNPMGQGSEQTPIVLLQ